MKKTNKKLLLALGTLTTVAAPVAAVVSCGAQEVRQFKLLPTYTGQVDQLLALGIHPDYYPYQLDKKDVFGYISHPERYISEKANGGNGFATKFAAALQGLMPSERGTSWWNQQALGDSEKGSDPEYWQHMSGDLVMYEHYLLDDGAKAVDASTAPKHYATDRTYLQTNFRESRDPFTRMPKVLVEALIDQDKFDLLPSASTERKFIIEMLDAARSVEDFRDADGEIVVQEAGADHTKLAVDGRPMPSGAPQRAAEDVKGKDVSWLYNDYFFAKSFHEDFLDNPDFFETAGGATSAKTDTAAEWVVNQNGETPGTSGTAGKRIFDLTDDAADKELAKLFFTATYTDEEKELQKMAYKKYTGEEYTVNIKPVAEKVAHHPIYEQQEDFGGAPMFEGAQRDNMLYFYNTASKLTKAFTAPVNPGDAASSDKKAKYAEELKAYNILVKSFGADSKTFKNARDAQTHANTISSQLRTRMNNISKLVTEANNPTFGLITLAPGEGATTVQTMSKYSFLYNELGFKQPLPTNLADLANDPVANTPGHPTTSGDDKVRESAKQTMFNMDDNGWWWNLGDTQADVAERATKFTGEFDLGLITANDAQYKNLTPATKGAFAQMFKGNTVTESNIDNLKVDYNLWNEGLKTPFVMNMMLDKITDMLVDKYAKTITSTPEITAAYNWGEYWTKTYLGK